MSDKLFGWSFVMAAAMVFAVKTYTPSNTETVCFDDEGDVIFYASGYRSNSEGRPLTHLTENIFLIKETGKKLHAKCKMSYSAQAPKGVEYYGGMKGE